LHKDLPETGDRIGVPVIAEDLLSMLLAAAMTVGLYGLMVAFAAPAIVAVAPPLVVSIIWIRKSADERDIMILFASLAVLCFGTGELVAYVPGGIFVFFAFLGLVQFWGLVRSKKLGGSSAYLLIVLLLQIAVSASEYAALRSLPEWSFLGLAGVYLFLALMLFMLPIALMAKASLQDDQ